MTAWVKEIAELLAVIAGIYVLLTFVGHRVRRWQAPFGRHRLRLLAACAAAVVLAQLCEEVLGRESDAVDRSLLLAVHARVPSQWDALFELFTTTASAAFLMPAIGAAAVLLAIVKRYRDAAQLAATALAASAAVYATKSLVGRTRPALWDTQWYWGSSFPSGHTLTAAAIATCLALSLLRTRAHARAGVIVVLVAWVAAVGASRLVLGVHWPTDVGAAACGGFLVALGVDALAGQLARRRRRFAPSVQPH